jgi:hypothetical protein
MEERNDEKPDRDEDIKLREEKLLLRTSSIKRYHKNSGYRVVLYIFPSIKRKKTAEKESRPSPFLPLLTTRNTLA